MTATPAMHDLRHALAELDGEIVSIGGRRGARLLSLVHHIAFGKDATDEATRLAIADDGLPPPRGVKRGPAMLPATGGKNIAIVTMHGVALPKFEYPGFAYATLGLAQTMQDLAADTSVSAIILDIDSPGGAVSGTPEAADAVYAARTRKPVIAQVSPLCASAAFWIGSQASQIVMASSGECGSLGVFLLHIDMSRMLDAEGVTPTFIQNVHSPHKTELNPYAPLSPDAKAFEQKQVDAIGRQFIAAVARGRGLSTATVEADFGRGRVLMAPDAKRVGMVDRIGGFDDVLRLASSRSAFLAARLAKLKTDQPAPTLTNESKAAERMRRLELLRQN